MLNKAILMGRLTADPEMRSTQGGKKVTSFTLAVNRNGKDAGTDFVDIVAWEKTAEFVCRYFRKGQQVAVSGRISTRSWEDQNGGKRKAVEVVAEEVHFAEGKKAGQNNNPEIGDPMAALGGFDSMPGDDPDLLPF